MRCFKNEYLSKLLFWLEEQIKRGATHGKERKKVGYQIYMTDYVVVLLSGGL